MYLSKHDTRSRSAAHLPLSDVEKQAPDRHKYNQERDLPDISILFDTILMHPLL